MLWAGYAGLAVTLGALALSLKAKAARGRVALLGFTAMLGAASLALIGLHVAERMGS